MYNLLDLLKNKKEFFQSIPFRVFVMQFPSPEEWSKLINVDSFLDSILELSIDSINLYIHIPFCDYLCKYCSFSKILFDKEKVWLFLKRLEKEISFWNYLLDFKNLKIKTIFIGGGTPTVLSEKQIYFLGDIFKKYGIYTEGEFTIETNPDRIEKKTFQARKNIGVNRISIGVQSFDRDILLKYGRKSIDFEKFLGKIELLNKLGFDNLNFDFIYGFNGQSYKSLENDLNAVLKILPKHLSFYPLILYNNFNNDIAVFFEELEKMYNFIAQFLENKYKFYTLEYATLNGIDSYIHKYQFNYLSGENVLGIGPSGFSFLQRLWFKNKFGFYDRYNSNFFVDFVYHVESNIEDYQRKFILGLRLNRIKRQVVKILINYYPEIKNFIERFFIEKGNIYFLKEGFRKYQNLLIYYFYYLFKNNARS